MRESTSLRALAHRSRADRLRGLTAPSHSAGVLGVILTLLCVAPCPLDADAPSQPPGKSVIPINDAPVFLLSGTAPNLILTIDDSGSMNRAFLPEGIWGTDDHPPPQIDQRDSSPLTNRQYYDPAQTYLPPRRADGTSWDHARFDSAALDAFASTNRDCTLNLDQHYVPTWSLQPLSGHACQDRMTTSAEALTNEYSADVGNSAYAEFLATASPDRYLRGRQWAWRCMASGLYDDCPAFYYRLNQTDTCASLDLSTGVANDFPLACLERVIVGSGEDIATIRTRENANVTGLVIENRRNLLKGTDGSTPTDKELAKRNFANWFSYYRTRFLTLQTVLSRVFSDLPSRMRFTYQNLPAEGQYLPGTDAFKTLADRFSTYANNRQAFYDWLFALNAGNGGTFLISAAARVHEFCRSDQAYVEHPKSNNGALLEAKDDATNPLHGCRNNFHVMFTDGNWEDTPGTAETADWNLVLPRSQSPRTDSELWLGNNDGTQTQLPQDSPAVRDLGVSQTYHPSSTAGTIFADHNSGMLADLVFASWIADLRPAEPAADQRVPALIRVPKGQDETADQFFWNPANDPADWQHITTYTIGLGVAGNARYPSGAWTYQDPHNAGMVSSGTLTADGFPGDWIAIGADLYGPNTRNADAIPAAVKIDDTWHAGINGRGGYLNAVNPDTLVTAFGEVLKAVSTLPEESSATAAAVNTGMTASDDVVYQARMNAKNWSGDLRSFRISGGQGRPPCADAEVLAGQLCEDPALGQYYRSAAKAMAGADNARTRRIFTAAEGVGIEFSTETWSDLTATQRLDFLRGAGFTGTDPADATDNELNEAKARLDYVRGDQTYERDGKRYRFRTRTTLLGDFINAAPVVIGRPSSAYQAGGYQRGANGAESFVQAHQNRVKLVYAGANDGMLHAFHADTLQEAFAFVPPVLMGVEGDTRPVDQQPGLHALSDPAYGGNTVAHRAFVDGPIATGDVRFGTARAADWRTVLIGGLGLGGQAIYALDVTRVPSEGAAVSAFAESMYLWQFTDRDDTTTNKDFWDPDLGYVFGRPAIYRIRGTDEDSDPIWVAIIGNGYNSSENDGSRAAGCDDAALDQGDTTCGQAVLYVIEIETGRVIKKFSTGVGRKDDPLHQRDPENRRPNALGQTTLVAATVRADGDTIADFVYAADLFGNLYRFDLTGQSETPIRRLFSATEPSVDGRTGRAQPITSPIAVARHPIGQGTLVLFGTGKYLDIEDASDRQVQSFFGIWDTGDDNQPPVVRTDLLRQRFEETNLIKLDADGKEVSRGRISTNLPIDWSTQKGWTIDFDIEKEGVDGLNKGERQVTRPEVQGGRVTFVSLVPENNPCAGGGYSWINTLDLRDGSRLELTPFDYNLDGSFGDSDLLRATDLNQLAGSSVRLTHGGMGTGVYSAPSNFGDGASRITTVVSTSKGNLALINTYMLLDWRVWQQLR